jgi:hypothetical protein
MCIPLGKHILISLALGLVVVACEHEGSNTPPVMTTSASLLSNEVAIQQVAHDRCTRAAECNILGNGRPYADKEQCMHAYEPGGGARVNVLACTEGVDKERLDKCLAVLRNQRCDADMGPETAESECRAYCAK